MRRKRKNRTFEVVQQFENFNQKRRKILNSYTTFKTIIRSLGTSDQYTAKNIRKEFLTTVKNPMSLVPRQYKGVTKDNILEDLSSSRCSWWRHLDPLKVQTITNYKTLCDVTFRRSNEWQLEEAIKCTWRTRPKLQNFIRKYTNKKIPNYYSHQVHLLLCLLLNVETNESKRKIEEENMNNLGRIFVSMSKIIIPEELMIIIFRFIPKNKRVLGDIGLVCSNFYLLYLKTCEEIKVTKKNIMEYPLLVIKYAKIIRFNTREILREEFLHFFKNTHSVRKLYLGWRATDQKIKDEALFKYVNTPKHNLYKIQVTNISDITIEIKFLPNVKKLSFADCNYNGPVKMKTVQFLHKIKHISFRSSYHHLTGARMIPVLLCELKGLETFHFNPINIFDMYPFTEVVQYMTGLKTLKFKDNQSLDVLSAFLKGNKIKNIKELYIKVHLTNFGIDMLLSNSFVQQKSIEIILCKLTNQKNIRRVHFTIYSKILSRLIYGVWSREEIFKTLLERFILKNKLVLPRKLKYTFFC